MSIIKLAAETRREIDMAGLVATKFRIDDSDVYPLVDEYLNNLILPPLDPDYRNQLARDVRAGKMCLMGMQVVVK